MFPRISLLWGSGLCLAKSTREICKAEAKQGLLPLKVVVVDAVAVEDAGRPPPVLTLTLRAAPSSLDSFQPKA